VDGFFRPIKPCCTDEAGRTGLLAGFPNCWVDSLRTSQRDFADSLKNGGFRDLARLVLGRGIGRRIARPRELPMSNLLTRDDTFFGVCQALGEDFGFSPNYLRIGLALGIFWSPMLMIGLYAGAAMVVLLSRLLIPEPRPATVAAAQAEDTERMTVEPEPAAIPLAA
jgi:phage shock protein C